jgi:endo-1,4-beta-mannosidase
MKSFILLMLSYVLIFGLTTSAQGCETPVDLAEYTTRDSRPFITLAADQFMAGDQPYTVQGINYYPKDYPWRRFLTETDTDAIRPEFDLMHDTGFNTLRIFLWNQALFQCDGRSILPVASAFRRLDATMQLATDYDFRLIVTLNDLPDVATLYDNPQHIQDQTQFIVNRYQSEPAILAWDLRNEGDIDYGSRNILQTLIPRTRVLEWLKDTSDLVRSIDSNHLITAGWLNEAHSTAPSVDFISFHHWTSPNELVNRIRALHLATSKPVLLQEVGYSTLHANITPDVQAEIIIQIIETSEAQNLLGWMIWTAFDFPITATCYPSPCQSPDNAEHYFGIWTVDYTPKPAVEQIQQYTES